jgi:energy-coupling factor transport system permease protein
MLKDITLGQFFPGHSFVHKMDARVKIICVILYIAWLFFVKTFAAYGVIAVFLAVVIISSKTPFKTVIKSVKPLMVIIVITSAINIFYTPGTTIFVLGFLKPTWEGLRSAAFMVLRIMFLIIGTSLLTYTTSPIMLTDAIERLLGPFKKIGLPVHELAMMMTIALRFIPTLIEETDKIMNAQKARGADFESGGIVKRATALVPILVPLFVSAFRRADELAIAMECRCYHGGAGRTRLKVMKMGSIDVAAIIIVFALLGGVLWANGLPY